MKKNNIIRLSSVFLIILTLFSCRGEFLETTPTEGVGEEAATATADNMMLIINGMHRNMYTRQNSSQGQVGQGAIMITMDALGEDLVFTTTGNGWYLSTVRWLVQPNDTGLDGFFPYQFYYSLIRNANTIIVRAAAATGDERTKNNAIGQAYAFRAFSYYMLVQLYGKRYVPGGGNTQLGVPLRLDLTDTPLARASVEEVYTQINNDLTRSIELLSNISRTVKSHFDISVVKGLKARVALTQGHYTDAATYAKEAKASYTLMSAADYTEGFNKLSNGEWIWGSEIVPDQTAFFGNFGAYMSRNFNSANIRTNPKAINSILYNSFPNSDIRKKNFDPTGAHATLMLPGNYRKMPFTSQKFLAASTSDSRMDIPYMRAAEMYLIEAEALARNGRESESKEVFNTLTKNRNPSYVGSTKTGSAYINEIMESRRLELWGEGFRFLDLKRLNQSLDRRGANHSGIVINQVYTIPAGDTRWEYLIPLAEINTNPLIVQNPR